MLTVFLCPPDRVGLPARMAALGLHSGRAPEIVYLVGSKVENCLRGWQVPGGIRSYNDRREIKGHLDALEDRGDIDLIIADWPEALQWPEVSKFRPRLILETWNAQDPESWGEDRKALRSRKRLESSSRSTLFSGFWPLVASPEDRFALKDIVERVDPWSGYSWVSSRGDAWFPELVKEPFVLMHCPSLDDQTILNAAANAIDDGDQESSVLVIRDQTVSVAHADRLVSCGIISELYLALQRARGVLMEPFPHLALAAACFGTKMTVCPYSSDDAALADFVSTRFGAYRGDPSEAPSAWLKRLMMGILEQPRPPAMDVSVEAQTMSLDAAVAWLDS